MTIFDENNTHTLKNNLPHDAQLQSNIVHKGGSPTSCFTGPATWKLHNNGRLPPQSPAVPIQELLSSQCRIGR